MYKSPISYVGSKKRELKVIHEYQPPNFDIVVDVFGGGGSVCLSYLPKNVVYNDNSSVMCELFNILKDEEKIKQLKEHIQNFDVNEENFKNVFNSKPSVERSIILSKLSLRGIPTTGLFKKDKKGNQEVKKIRLDVDYVLPPNFQITNKDYKQVLDDYKDNVNAFLYLDPPYIDVLDCYKSGFSVDDFFYILEYMRESSTKCKIMLNVDYTGFTREYVSELFKHGYPVRYNLSTSRASGDVYGKYHLMACNY